MARSLWPTKRRAYARALDAMMTISGEAALAIGHDGTIIAANSWAYRLLGWPATDGLVGGNVEMLVPEARRPRHHALRESYLALPLHRPMGVDMQIQARRYDGSVIPVEIGLAPLNGWIIAVIKPTPSPVAAGRDA